MIFRQTLLRLTVLYSVLLLLVFILFSGSIYLYMDSTLGGDSPHATKEGILIGNKTDSSLDRLLDGLFISYVGLLVVVPAVSYILARRSLKPVEASFTEQQRFADDASHELRTPLSVLQGELELALSRKHTLTEYRAAIQTSLEEIGSLISLTDNLLLVTRGARSELKKTFVAMGLGTILEQAVNEVATIYEPKKLQFKVESTPCRIYGEPELVKRAIINILENAAKFSRHDSRITVRLTQQHGEVEVIVQDEGIGMPSDELKQAFKRFWRADSARIIDGHGLGLPLVYQIMELHGGSIEISSVPEKGTKVQLSFPRLSSK